MAALWVVGAAAAITGVVWWVWLRTGPPAPGRSYAGRGALDSLTAELEVDLSGRPAPASVQQLGEWMRARAEGREARLREGGAPALRYAILRSPSPASDAPATIAVWEGPTGDSWRRTCAQVHVDLAAAALRSEELPCTPDVPPAPPEHAADGAAPVVGASLATHGTLVRGTAMPLGHPVAGGMPVKSTRWWAPDCTAAQVVAEYRAESQELHVVNLSHEECELDPLSAVRPRPGAAWYGVRVERPESSWNSLATRPPEPITLRPMESAATSVKGLSPGSAEDGAQPDVEVGDEAIPVRAASGESWTTLEADEAWAAGWHSRGYVGTGGDQDEPEVAIAAPCIPDQLAYSVSHGPNGPSDEDPVLRSIAANIGAWACRVDATASGGPAVFPPGFGAQVPGGTDGHFYRRKVLGSWVEVK